MRWRIISASVLMSVALQAAAAEAGGVQLADSVRIEGQTLRLNGAGVREKFVFKAYAIGLYLPQPAESLDAIRSMPGPRRIELVALRELTADQLCDALNEFLHKNHSAPELIRLQARIDSLNRIMQSVGLATKNTRFDLDYLPGTGTRILVNGNKVGEDIPGEDFNLALLKIWLGREVPQESLRTALLGQK